MTKEEFKEALLEELEKRFDNELAEYKEKYGDEPHVFSAEHEAKMRAIFDNFEKKQRRRRRTRVALAIAACAVFVLGLTACTVPQIKNSVAGFFVQVFGDHTEYTDPAVTKECIEEEYGLVPVPEGFEVTDKVMSDTALAIIYSNAAEDTISFHQFSGKNNAASIDNQHGDFSEYAIGNKLVRVYYAKDFVQASWVEDGYLFSLSFNAPIEQTMFEEWIASVSRLGQNNRTSAVKAGVLFYSIGHGFS